MKKISILGSTGSIGTSTLSVVDSFPDKLEVVALAAGSNVAALAHQIRKYRPSLVSVQSEEGVATLRELLGTDAGNIDIMTGDAGAIAVATHPDAATVIAAIVGAAGIRPVYAALERGKRVGFANKEVLVAAGDLITRAAHKFGGEILPIDSEHNALHQALRCGRTKEVRRLILTASGGPFLHRDLDTFGEITVEAALAHPTWKMGNKISIDSATMMNKGLEVIEAHHLFGFGFDDIDIVVHPQSVVHSMVEFIDGSVIAQMSTNDMRFPIQYSLLYPERTTAPFDRLDFARIRHLDFVELDRGRFPAVDLAYQAGRTGGSMPAVLNAANEVAVARFLAREIPYRAITDIVQRVMDRHAREVSEVRSIDEALAWDQWARGEAHGIDVAERELRT